MTTYAAPVDVAPIYNPADFDTKIFSSNVSSSGGDSYSATVDAQQATTDALVAQVNSLFLASNNIFGYIPTSPNNPTNLLETIVIGSFPKGTYLVSYNCSGNLNGITGTLDCYSCILNDSNVVLSQNDVSFSGGTSTGVSCPCVIFSGTHIIVLPNTRTLQLGFYFGNSNAGYTYTLGSTVNSNGSNFSVIKLA